MPFASTLLQNWILESRSNKNKIQERLYAAPDLRIKLSNTKPKPKVKRIYGRNKNRKKTTVH
jgi:hypothetical protein